MADEGRVERRLLLSVDARGYGGAPVRMQGDIQQGLLDVLDVAAKETGLKRDTWSRQPGGDGELAVLPPEEPEVRVVERFPRELDDALFRHNRDLNRDARLRLRLAVHFGTAKPGPNGYAHAGPVVVSRLCDSDQLRNALMTSGADLAVIFSRQIYTDTIRSGLTILDPSGLRRVRVTKKEFDEDAWIWVPGRAVAGRDVPGSSPASAPLKGNGPRRPVSTGDPGTTDAAVAGSFEEAAERQRKKKAALGDDPFDGAVSSAADLVGEDPE